MTTDERIIKYIENELSPQERNFFEVDLNNSVELRNELGKYMRAKEETVNLKKLKLNPFYLNSLIHEFRQKLDLQKSVSVKKNLGYAFGIMLVFVLSIAILKNFFINESKNIDIQEFTESLNENQRIELLAELNGESEILNLISKNISDKELTNLYSANLEVNNEVAEAYDIEYNDLIVNLSQNEVDEIYQEILNRKF